MVSKRIQYTLNNQRTSLMNIITRRFKLTLICILIFNTISSYADVIKTQDGSHLNVKIKSFGKGKFVVESQFAGVLNIQHADVKDFITDEDMYVALDDGTTFLGKLDISGKIKKIRTKGGILEVSGNNIVAIWEKGAENPLTPKPDKPAEKPTWGYKANIHISGKTGNSEKFNSGGGLKATRTGLDNKLIIYLKGERSRENSSTTVKEIVAGIDYESSQKSSKHSKYARLELETDDIELVDLRSTAAVGYGYFFKKEDNQVLRGRTGLQVRNEEFKSGDTNSSLGIDLGLYHMKLLSDWGKLTSDLTYTPSFEDIGDYRIYHESSLSIPLARLDFWKLKIGISNEYNSLIAKGRKRLDTTYFTHLVLSWE